MERFRDWFVMRRRKRLAMIVNSFDDMAIFLYHCQTDNFAFLVLAKRSVSVDDAIDSKLNHSKLL